MLSNSSSCIRTVELFLPQFPHFFFVILPDLVWFPHSEMILHQLLLSVIADDDEVMT